MIKTHIEKNIKYSEKKKEKKSIFERQKDNKDHIVF